MDDSCTTTVCLVFIVCVLDPIQKAHLNRKLQIPIRRFAKGFIGLSGNPTAVSRLLGF